MRFIVSVFLLLFTSTFAFSQILDKTENRAKQKANQRVDRKIDQGLDKGLDAIEGIFKKKDKPAKTEDKKGSSSSQSNQSDSEQEAADMLSKMFGGSSSSANIKDNYAFDHSVLVGIQSFDSKGKANDEMEMKMHFSNRDTYIGMDMTPHGTPGFAIFDFESFQMITLLQSEGEKMGVAMNLNPDAVDNDSEDSKEGDYKFTKTGKTKVISGYSCQEYKAETPDDEPGSETYLWMTQDIKSDWMKNYANAMSANTRMSKGASIPKGYPAGSMIQMVNQSTKNQEKTILTVKKFNDKDKLDVSTKDYQIMNMGSLE